MVQAKQKKLLYDQCGDIQNQSYRDFCSILETYCEDFKGLLVNYRKNTTRLDEIYRWTKADINASAQDFTVGRNEITQRKEAIARNKRHATQNSQTLQKVKIQVRDSKIKKLKREEGRTGGCT